MVVVNAQIKLPRKFLVDKTIPTLSYFVYGVLAPLPDENKKNRSLKKWGWVVGST